MTGRLVNTIYKKFLNMKISLKLTLSYLAGAAACMLILSVFYYINTKNYIDTQTKELLGQALEQAKDNIDDKVDLYNMLSDSIFLNTNLQELLFNEYPDPSGKLDAQSWILAYIRPLKSSYKDLARAALIVSNSTIPPYGNEIASENSVRDSSWYREAIKPDQKTLWVSGADAGSPENIILRRRLDHLTYDSFLGVLQLDLNKDTLFRTLHEERKNENGWFDIIDAGDNFIYSGMDSNDSAFKNTVLTEYRKLLFNAPSNNAIINVNNLEYLTLQDRVDYTGWRIIYTVPLSSYSDAIKRLQLAGVSILLISALLFIAISWFLASNFTRKIRELSHSMEKIQTGRFDVYISYPGNDEIGHLISGFNIMARKLKELVEEVFTIKIKEKEFELQALQAQINPHFLYNTLASISMLGMRIGGEDIAKMSNSLAKFYKISLSKGSNIIKVKDEIDHVKAYMDIQNIRFKNKINIFYEIDEAVLESKSLKLMLQPFIENAISHGLWKDKKSITIYLSVTRENDEIVWKIIDDGVGIGRQRLESILGSAESQYRGYGIVNVDQRIKLFFGDRYGVSIFSRAGIGTVITICTPMLMEDS